jgi:hypothetical protein
MIVTVTGVPGLVVGPVAPERRAAHIKGSRGNPDPPWPYSQELMNLSWASHGPPICSVMSLPLMRTRIRPGPRNCRFYKSFGSNGCVKVTGLLASCAVFGPRTRTVPGSFDQAYRALVYKSAGRGGRGYSCQGTLS